MRNFVSIVVAALFAAVTLSVYAADEKLKTESAVGETRAGTPANKDPHTEDAKYQSSAGEKRGGAPTSPTSSATEPIKVESDAGKPLGQGSPAASAAKKK